MRPQLQHLTACAVLVLGLADGASAQAASAMGTVKDQAGKAIKGATVRAVNPDASPSQFASATDDKGRWAMIGLRSGTWRFIVEAPGYFTVETTVPVRVAASPPLTFTLARDPGPDSQRARSQHRAADSRRGDAARSGTHRSGAGRLPGHPRSGTRS